MQEDSQNILVLGVGRSGTTAIYSLLQEILEDKYPEDIDYMYENFLWDRNTFNRRIKDVTFDFSAVSTLSIDGIYHHKKLPIIMKGLEGVQSESSRWLQAALSPIKKKHFLGKMIRASGRMPLIRHLKPELKIVYIIRNPVDVINSAINLFSFLGSDFYSSDLERFTQEVGKNISEFESDYQLEDSTVSREYGYWLYNNLAFIEFMNVNSSRNILLINHDDYIKCPEKIIRGICNFIVVDYEEKYFTSSKVKVGHVRGGKCAISESEFVYLQDRLIDYKNLLEMAGHKMDVDLHHRIHEKYAGRIFQAQDRTETVTLNSLAAKQNSILLEGKCELLESKCEAVSHEMVISTLKMEELHLRLDKIKQSKGYRLYQFINRKLGGMLSYMGLKK
jgi:hypothetical protein